MEKLRIFAASPSDMVSERAKVETVGEMLKPLADNLGILLEVVDWQRAMPDMGRPEQVILDQLKATAWDVFIGILWHRFGTTPGGKDPQTQKEYLSGTEEEFNTAYRLWKQFGKPRIMMYRCTRAIPPDALDLKQFKSVKKLFARFDAVKGRHPGLYQSFDTTEAFEKLLLDNLQRLLLEYGEQIRGKPVSPEFVRAYAPKIPDNLPRRAPFFGREKEMAIVLRALTPEDRTWGVLVDGIGGNGKTALAVEAAYRCKEKDLFDAFIFISAKQTILVPGGIRELRPSAQTVDEFFNETAYVLGQSGIAQLASDGKHRTLLDALRAVRSLLIYDNLETLTKEEQEAIADFLRGLPPGCKAIITSRRRGGEGAVWLRLEKLEWKAARAIIETEMARATQLENKLRDVGEMRWQELYDETKGSPLALVHALGLMRMRATLTFDGMVEMLRGNRTPDLQKFIFQEARKEMTNSDEAALRALSFFVSPASFEQWMGVAQLSRNALETTIDRLSALSLVDVLAGEERFALHPLIRNFVRDELLSYMQVANEMGRRFAEYWITYIKGYVPYNKERYKAFKAFEAEWANLAAAADWLWQTAAVRGDYVGDKDAAQKLNNLVNSVTDFLVFSGRWDELLQLCAWGYEAMRILEEWNAAGWRAYISAWIYIMCNSTDEAVLWIDRCDNVWSLSSDKNKTASIMQVRGLVAKQLQDFDVAERLFNNALTIYSDLKSDGDIGRVLTSLGNLEEERKAYDVAERYFRESLEIGKKQDDIASIAVTICNLGELAIARGRWSEAHKLCEEGLRFAREAGRQDVISGGAYCLALVLETEGCSDLALPLAQEALAMQERLRDKDLPKTKELVERLRGKVGSNS